MLYYSLEVAKGPWKTYGAAGPEMHDPGTAAAQVAFHRPCPSTAGLHSQLCQILPSTHTAEVNQKPVATLGHA